jgi:hypothetical protein
MGFVIDDEDTPHTDAFSRIHGSVPREGMGHPVVPGGHRLNRRSPGLAGRAGARRLEVRRAAEMFTTARVQSQRVGGGVAGLTASKSAGYSERFAIPRSIFRERE